MEQVRGLTTPLTVWGKKTLPISKIKKILIRGTNWIGDAVMTLPALKALRDNFPQGHLTVLAKPWVKEIYLLSHLIDEVILYDDSHEHRGLGGRLKLCKRLKREKFDLALLFQNAIEAALIAFFARIPIRAGYDTDGRLLLLTHAVRRRRYVLHLHQTRYYLEMVRALGIEAEYSQPRIFPPEPVNLNLPVGDLIGIAPGAQYGPAKRWFPDRFAALSDLLLDTFASHIILLGSKADRDVTKEIKKQSRHTLIDLAGETSLAEAVAIMAQLRVFVTNDSGLMHVACALGIPVVAIFGSTDPTTTGPVGDRVRIIHHPVSCSPCLKTHCPTDFRCMDQIQVEEVFSAVKDLWE
ncbi:MAG: lipopolysaccharide heptosyltransferase II [Syntrophales bacterium]|nr:lipopolysaccharide heptosyltransferase II [Syntrophales bacterium]